MKTRMFFFIIALIVVCVSLLLFIQKPQTDDAMQGYIDNSHIKPDYSAHYVRYFSSSSGDRRWDITYAIENESFISCSGNYSFNGASLRYVECSLSAIGKDPFSDLNSLTMGGILNALRDEIALNFSSSEMLGIGNRTCFHYDAGQNYDIEFRSLLVCFNDSYIVDYAFNKAYGGEHSFWNMEGYDFTEEMRSLLS